MEKCLQEVMDKVVELVSERKELTVTLSNKQEQHEEVMALRENARNKEVFLSIVADMEKCIHDIKKQIQQLEVKIEGLDSEESWLKQDLEAKRKELSA